MGQVLWGFRSTTGIRIPHASSHGCHKKTSWRFRKQYSVFCGKGLFVSTHKGCRSFLAAPAQGELSQDSDPSETGQEGLQGRVRNEDVRHWQGRERGRVIPATNQLLFPWEIRSKEKEVSSVGSYATVKFSGHLLLVLDQVLDLHGQNPYCMMCLGYSLAKGFPPQSSM